MSQSLPVKTPTPRALRDALAEAPLRGSAAPLVVAPQVVRKLTAEAGEHPAGRAHVCAASGLVMIGRRCFVVADDELHLASFDAVASGPIEFLQLLPGLLPDNAAARKAAKPDFEVLLHLEPQHWPTLEGRRALLAMGSGSTPTTRNLGVLLMFKDAGAADAPLVDLFDAGVVIDLGPIFALLRQQLGGLNIEGAVVVGDRLKLLQRESQATGSCTVVEFELAPFLRWLLEQASKVALRVPVPVPVPTPVKVQRVDLGSAQGVALAPTDATSLGDGLWLASAVAEDTQSSYDDGPCVGSAVVLLNAENAVLRSWALAGSPKVEGIQAHFERGGWVLTMVTDADDPGVASELLTLNLDLRVSAASILD